MMERLLIMKCEWIVLQGRQTHSPAQPAVWTCIMKRNKSRKERGRWRRKAVWWHLEGETGRMFKIDLCHCGCARSKALCLKAVFKKWRSPHLTLLKAWDRMCIELNSEILARVMWIVNNVEKSYINRLVYLKWKFCHCSFIILSF